jgi:hypothetical protein
MMGLTQSFGQQNLVLSSLSYFVFCESLRIDVDFKCNFINVLYPFCCHCLPAGREQTRN